ncbi:MAG: response regulator [Planctomycetes bacterium]|nr:response regulator [Planctomycetota bacterium]
MATSNPEILVVDDDLDTCENLRDILCDLGYTVQTAQSGPEALELVRQTSFDLALLDFRMPGMDGLVLYREIKRLSPSTVAIIMSAFLTADTIDEAHGAGTWKVLSKPIDLGVVLPLLEEALSWPTILLVDDDRDLCANLWDVLHDRGYRCSLAHSVPASTRLIQERQFDVVLLDLKLPEGSAQDVLRALHGAYPEAKVVLMTGFRSELQTLISDALAGSADAVCYKPFDVDHLLGTITQLISSSREPEPASQPDPAPES